MESVTADKMTSHSFDVNYSLPVALMRYPSRVRQIRIQTAKQHINAKKNDKFSGERATENPILFKISCILKLFSCNSKACSRISSFIFPLSDILPSISNFLKITSLRLCFPCDRPIVKNYKYRIPC